MTAPNVMMTQLLDYLIEQQKVIEPGQFDVARAGYHWTPQDLQQLPGITFNEAIEGDHVWLRVQRLKATPPPALTDTNAAEWLILSEKPDGPEPSFNEQHLQFRLAQGEFETEEARQRVEQVWRATGLQALEAYLPRWRDWAAGERPRRRAISVYAHLFALKQLLDSESSQRPLELVWGIGLASDQLTWVTPKSSAVRAYRYPMLTQAVEVQIDAKTHTLSVSPKDSEPRVELDAFAATGKASAIDAQQIARRMLGEQDERVLSPFDASTYEGILRAMVGILDGSGSYLAADAETPPRGLSVRDDWVLFARIRPSDVITDDIEALKVALREGGQLPPGPAAIVTHPAEERATHAPLKLRGVSHPSTDPHVQDLLFPLPFNDQQMEIVELLERSPGVAVSGPPGTGKSHTAANLLCHYLATGRRVLVCSQGEQALRVLQEKIPEEVRPLALAMLSGDHASQKAFQSSIDTIMQRITQLNERETEQQIDTLRRTIDQIHRDLVAIDSEMHSIAHANLSDLNVDGRVARPEQLAKWLIESAERFAWFDDVLTTEAKHQRPLTETESRRLLGARRALGTRLPYASYKVAATADLPAPDAIPDLHARLVALAQVTTQEEQGEAWRLRDLTPTTMAKARTLQELLTGALARQRRLEASGYDWANALRRNLAREDLSSEREALEALYPEIEALIESRKAFVKQPVALDPAVLQVKGVEQALERLAKGEAAFAWYAMVGQSDAKAALASIKVAGQPPQSASEWVHVRAFLDLHTDVVRFAARWNAVADALSLPSITPGVDAIRETELFAKAAREAGMLASDDHEVMAQLASVFTLTQAPRPGQPETLPEIHAQLERQLGKLALADAQQQRTLMLERLAGKQGAVSEGLRHFVTHELGTPERSAAEVVERYTQLYGELAEVERLLEDRTVVHDYALRLAGAGAVKLAARILHTPTEGVADDPIWRSDWAEAWEYARVRAHLEAIDGAARLRKLAKDRTDHETALRRAYERIVSLSAWLTTKKTAGPRVLSALETYRTAVRKIGRGTGPNAVRHRRDARRAMIDAQSAVPCWIMSSTRVSEQLPATLGSFDLVMVDEASQSDLHSLPAVLRGKKLLVIGDDKQVSPDGAFISAARIQELRDRYLPGQPFEAMLTPEKSLFDLATAVYAGSKVMLTEHFRSAPVLIGYSNQTFYENKIVPLRIPKASERLEPPLIDVYLDGGRRTDHFNLDEAEIIAKMVVEIINDPAYAERSLGVVSLLGEEQAKLIDEKVRTICDPGELMRRQFECGDARRFQGAERDIMLLSMVVDPAQSRALSGLKFEQRINVACSRARDRMILVRSVTLEQLSANDLRRTLVGYLQRPQAQSTDDITDLAHLCESEFEREVFMALIERGYRVIPQVSSGAFRIDMVVEGAGDNRLAIECDGDAFHGPDKWPQDVRRQRVLERAGWKFWRCFASNWVMRRQECLDDLLGTLHFLRIDPIGADARVPQLVERRVHKIEHTVDPAVADMIEDLARDG